MAESDTYRGAITANRLKPTKPIPLALRGLEAPQRAVVHRKSSKGIARKRSETKESVFSAALIGAPADKTLLAAVFIG
jgi:hypothetical protein